MGNFVVQRESTFKPNQHQIRYLAAVLDPSVDNDPVLIARHLDLRRATIVEWHRDPVFQDWFEREIERRLSTEVATVWKEVLTCIKNPSTDPRTKLDYCKLFLGRFDHEAKGTLIRLQNQSAAHGQPRRPRAASR